MLICNCFDPSIATQVAHFLKSSNHVILVEMFSQVWPTHLVKRALIVLALIFPCTYCTHPNALVHVGVQLPLCLLPPTSTGWTKLVVAGAPSQDLFCVSPLKLFNIVSHLPFVLIKHYCSIILGVWQAIVPTDGGSTYSLQLHLTTCSPDRSCSTVSHTAAE